MTQRDRLILIAGASVAIILAVWLLVVSPRRGEASSLAAKVASTQTQLQGLQATLAQHEQARATFARSYAEITRLGEAVPADDDVPSLLYQLQSAAKVSGIDFNTITLAAAGNSPAAANANSAFTPASLPPGAAVGAAGFPSENFTFNFVGNFHRLANFFARLENQVISNGTSLAVSGRLMTLDSIALSPASGGFPQISASVTATTYILPLTQGLLAGASAAGPSTGLGTTQQTGANPAPKSASASIGLPTPAAAVTP